VIDRQLVEQDDLENGVYFMRRKDAERKGLFERETQFERHIYPVWKATGSESDDWWFQDYAQYHADRGGGDLQKVRERARNLQQQFVLPLKTYSFPVVELASDIPLASAVG
jgi:hypothetical protein